MNPRSNKGSTSEKPRTTLRLVAAAKLTLWMLVAAIAWVGCKSVSSSASPRSNAGEYRQVTGHFIKAVDETLRLLNRATSPTTRNPRAAILKFADAVDTLEVDSMAARARAEAMRARGQAYFATWQEHLAVVQDERVRQLALQHRAELDVRFPRIHTAAQHARETFRPFLADLKTLRDSLESNPTAAHIASKDARIARTKAQGRAVQDALSVLMAELNATAALLTPPGKTTQRP